MRVYESETSATRARGWYLLLAGASAGLLCSAPVPGEVLTRRIARPLVRTAETAQQLAQGDTTARHRPTAPARWRTSASR